MKYIKETIMQLTKRNVLLASAIAAASGTATAATWVTDLTASKVTHTIEGIDKIAEATGVVSSNAVVRLGSVYAQNDTIKFTYNKAKATDYNWPTALTSIKSGTAKATLQSKGVTAKDSVTMKTETLLAGASVTGIALGDICTFAIVAGSYRITKTTGTTAITFTPKLATATVSGEDMTCQQLKFMEFGLINSDDTSVTYRVTSVNATGTSTVGSEIAAPAPDISPDALETSAATVAFSAATSTGTAMDALAATQTIAEAKAEFTPSVTTAWNATIDVETDKVDFSAGSDSADTQDDLTFAVTTIAGTAGNKVAVNASGVLDMTNAVAIKKTTANTMVLTVDADFTWMDDDTATAGITADAAAIASAQFNSDALNSAGTQITLSDTDGVVASYTVALVTTEGAVLPVQTYTGTSVITYTSGADATPTKTTTHTDLGAWTLNGASINVYGVPFGDTTSRFLTVGNKGASSAVVSGTVQWAGTSYGPYELATVPAKSSTAVGPALDTALANAGVTIPSNARGMVILDSPVKDADITVSAAYKANNDSDRLSLETSDSLVSTVK
jgi:hypothetical protein